MNIAKIPLLTRALVRVRAFKDQLLSYGFDPFEGKIQYNKNLGLFSSECKTLYAISPRKAYQEVTEFLAQLMREKVSPYVLRIEIDFPREDGSVYAEHYMFLVMMLATGIANDEKLKDVVDGMFCYLDANHKGQYKINLIVFTRFYADHPAVKEIIRSHWKCSDYTAFYSDHFELAEGLINYSNKPLLESFVQQLDKDIRDRSTVYVNFYDFTKDYGRHVHAEVFTGQDRET